jgi:exosortase
MFARPDLGYHRAAADQKELVSVTIPNATADVRAAAPRPRPSASSFLLILVAIELVALYAPTARWLYERWTLSVWHNVHGMLIPFAVAYFASIELRDMKHLPADANRWGFLFLGVALAMHVLDTGIHTQILSAASIVVALPGLSLIFLGTARTKAIAIPLAFMVFMLPLPLVLTERVHLLLREIATQAATVVVPLLGIAVFSEGTNLHLREGILAISDACSGFSTLYASAAVAALVAYSCDRMSGKLMALVGAVPIAIAANIIRIVLLVLAVRMMGIDILDTWLHPASGMLTFAIALPAILWLGRPSLSAGSTSAS